MRSSRIPAVSVFLLFASLTLALGACSRKPAAKPGSNSAVPTRPSASKTAATADQGGLPIVDTRGAPPGKLKGPVVMLTADEHGKVELEGKEVSDSKALMAALLPLANAHRDMSSKVQPSEIQLVIHADQRLPWGVVQWLLQAAADPDIRVHKILFAVRGERDPAERTFATYLPCDLGVARTPQIPKGTSTVLRRTVGLSLKEKGTLEFQALHAALARDANVKAIREAEIEAAPDLALGDVLAAADTVLRCGIDKITFVGTRGPRAGQAFAARTKELLDARGKQTAVLTLDGKPLPPERDALPVPPGWVSSGVEGITDPGVVGQPVPVVVDPEFPSAGPSRKK